MNFEIEDIRRISRKPGDVIVITYPSEQGQEYGDLIIKALNDLLDGVEMRFMVVPSGVDFKAIPADEARRMNFEF